MAGHGAKKAAARVKHTLALYLTIAVLANAAYFGVRLLAWGQRLTKGEWTGALFLEGLYALALFVSGDNLRKGAALNAVQIAESLVRLGIIA